MPTADVLIYTRTAGYRHDSIPDGATALTELARDLGRAAEVTEDPGVFTPGRLAGCAAVVLLSTTGNVLTPEGRSAFEAYLRGGGALLAVHAAANAEPDWPFYGELLGTRFDGHPEIQPGVVLVDGHDHPATAPLPARWAWTDEWYNFTSDPRGTDRLGTGAPGASESGVRVLARADESTYRGGTHGDDHPLVWCREIDRGRMFFTALGHASETYRDPAFRAHLSGALSWLTS
ncbi:MULTISPECIES: ThuA domain-containing protein [Streptomyces]|uniref:Cytochrome c551 or c552 n=1 Tax=Streptomyces venezuelae (strain ATCC 10712 / CBS 650.69 / DSM 40230 / JCM 4526 / NBRC 13096 / PD 04745) TaxID=953739 RepID=F2R5V1_STRVP|nr:ThuA domain-containing protein [Streptomyces venezuelae]APE19810.1 Crp/Fnr family transcriptional regulator [Streptomyces venezuelae]QER97218.1 ThuA domain-containing protein [Streptomyces venezuelae ATCC 10712]CCA53612.1 Cytochrome c551 or c552 [Streptomyces venezuelae ATCC 10712]